MKKIAISMLIAFVTMILSAFITMQLIGYENFIILQQKHLLSIEMVNKQAEIMTKYGNVIFLCSLPTFVAIGYVIYCFYKDFTKPTW